MEKRYRQLSLEERCQIAGLQGAGSSFRQIAAALNRAPSTIAREIKRNQGTQEAYNPAYADQQARARRWSGLKLERQRELRDKVLTAPGAGRSPEQVAGRLAVESGSQVINHESIYRFSMHSWRAPKITIGGSICPVPNPNAAGAAASAALQFASSKLACPSRPAPFAPPIAKSPTIGRPI